MNFSDFKLSNVSEKVLLAKINAGKRLIGFELHSGSIYKLSDFDFESINFVKDSAVEISPVSSLSSVVAGSYFNDRQNKILYLRTSDSVNPNGKFISINFENFFSNVGVIAPKDLSNGDDVHWRPLIKSASGFGVALDNEDQIGFALEGSGTISFILDREYFDEVFEGFLWENQLAQVYVWNRNLAITDAQIIFRGSVNSKRFAKTVEFRFKDQLKALRQPFPLDPLSDIVGARIPDGLLNAKKRRIYGRPNGVRPTNIDQVVEQYELAGTISVTGGSAVVTGSGTSFLSWFSPDDRMFFLGFEYVVESIQSDTSLTLTEAVEFTATGITHSIEPEFPKNFINREWLVAGHACSQIETTVVNADGQNIIYLSEFNDIKEGDEIYFGSAGNMERSFVNRIFSNGKVELTSNLENPPSNGTEVIRPCVQDLRINNNRLLFDRDYDIVISSDETKIVLNSDAEKNINPTRSINGTVQFTNGSDNVVGTNTNFTSQLEPGQHIRAVGQVAFFQILSIESDTALTLISNATYSENTGAKYKGGRNFDPEFDVLSCTVVGATDDGTISGNCLIKPGSIVEDILTIAGLPNLNTASFELADDSAPYDLGLVIPKTFSTTNSPNVRDLINEINVSVFGSLVQNEDFEIEYNILKPNRPVGAIKLTESDILELTVESSNDRIVKTARVEYDKREYSPLTQDVSSMFVEKTSDTSLYLTGAEEERLIQSVLINQNDAQILANRWSFLLEIATNVIKIKTKMQTIDLQVNDVIFIEHSKLFERLGGGKRKFAAIQAIRKTAFGVEIEADDLANAFNRVCVINDNDAPTFDQATLDERAALGFITDQYGLINNSNFGFNLIW